MRVGFNVPQTVGQRGVLVARHLLLLEAPVGKLDLVREEVAAGEEVSEPEVGPKSEQVLASSTGRRVMELDDKDVVAAKKRGE